MKFGIWTLLWSFFLWSVNVHSWAPHAHAAGTTLNGTQAGSGTVSTPKVTTVPQTQKNAENQTKDLNKQGQNQSNSVGMAAIAAGMAMIAAGIVLMSNPPTIPPGVALVAAGTALVMSGMKALAAAKKMGNNANTANNLGTNLGNLGQSTLKGVKLDDTTDPGIKIDPSLLRNEKVKSKLDDLEKKTGIKGEDLLKGLEDGKNPADILAATGKFGSADKIQGLMDKFGADQAPLSGQEMKDKLGLTDEDVASMGGDSNVYAGGGAPGGGKKTDSAAGDLAALLGGGASGAGDGSGTVGGLPNGQLSDEVQAALDKNGITGRTIFEMVRSQYKKKTPMMFGVAQKKVSPNGDNPFANLSGGGLEL